MKHLYSSQDLLSHGVFFSLGLIRGNVLHLQIHYNISNDKSIFKLLSICNFTLQSFLPFPPSLGECVDWSLFCLMLSKINCSLAKTAFFN